jgi:hypothetical protein
MTEQKVHGNTKKAADMALANRLISRASQGERVGARPGAGRYRPG